MSIYIPTPEEAINLAHENKYKYHNIIKYHLRDFHNYLEQNYTGKTLAEKLYRYCYNPVVSCKNCGSPNVGFLEFTTGFRQYCSTACTGTSEANKIGREKYLSDPTRVQAQLEKSVETSLRKYGKTHWRKTEEGRLHTAQTSAKIIKERFSSSVKNRKHKKHYIYTVRALTDQVYRQYKDIIDPEHKRSFNWVIDHIFSINDGYEHGVPVEILSHWTNLKIISRKENSSKGCKSNITIEELYRLYEGANQAEPVSSTPLPCSK
jgi:hypothetical protein